MIKLLEQVKKLSRGISPYLKEWAIYLVVISLLLISIRMVITDSMVIYTENIQSEKSQSDFIQVFFPIDDAYSEENSEKGYFVENITDSVKIALPQTLVNHVRIYPANKAAEVVITKIEFRYLFGSKIYLPPDLLAHSKPYQMIDRLELTPSGLFIRSTGNVPVFELQLPKRRSILFQCIMLFIGSIPLSLAVFFGVKKLANPFSREIFEFDFTSFRFCVAIFLLLYGYELSNFTLSIDEELYSFSTNNNFQGWISQGRWGMALIGASLPPISAMPVISPAIFGIGLTFSALHFSKTFHLDNDESIVFCGMFVLSPIWPHIIEFNTLSYGIGVGLVSVAVGTRLMLKKDRVAFFTAAILWAFATAIYQSFLFLSALILCISIIFQSRHQGEVASVKAIIKSLYRSILLLFLTLGLYLAIQIVFNKMFYIGISYINNDDYIGAYVNDFSQTFDYATGRILDFLLGTGQIYLGWGKVIVILPFIGIVILCRTVLAKLGNYQVKILFITLIFLSLMASIVPFFIFAGLVPARATLWLPFLFAVFSAFAMNVGKYRVVIWGLFVANIIVGAFISNSLFYTDALAREQDRVLAINLIQRINNRLDMQPSNNGMAGIKKNIRPISSYSNDGWRNDGWVKFAIVGIHHTTQPVKEIEMFGLSFFSLDAFRVNHYFNILGMTDLTPIPITNMSLEEVMAAQAMPVWPATNSVALVDDLLIIKLSEMTEIQKSAICDKHKDWSYCDHKQ